MRKFECKDRERVLRSQDQAPLEVLERHAQSCAQCAQELRWWNDISAAAQSMRRSWDSPELWLRIRRVLAAEALAGRQRPRAWSLAELWSSAPPWGLAAALVVLLVVMTSGMWHLMRRPAQVLSPEAQRRLLTEQALRDALDFRRNGGRRGSGRLGGLRGWSRLAAGGEHRQGAKYRGSCDGAHRIFKLPKDLGMPALFR